VAVMSWFYDGCVAVVRWFYPSCHWHRFVIRNKFFSLYCIYMNNICVLHVCPHVCVHTHTHQTCSHTHNWGKVCRTTEYSLEIIWNISVDRTYRCQCLILRAVYFRITSHVCVNGRWPPLIHRLFFSVMF
jgi:hypothetical protein